MRQVPRWPAGLLVAGILSLALLPAWARAHAVVHPRLARPGTYQKYVLRVPNEREVPTLRVELTFPKDLQVVSFGEVDGWELQVEPVLRCGIAATKVHVRAEETGVIRTAAHIAGLVEEARLPERVARRALAAFRALAEVEGRLHRRPPEQVHFHEVGGLDAIVDVVGTAAALE